MEASQLSGPQPVASNVTLERIALGIATVLTAAALAVVPEWNDLLDPCMVATISGALTVIMIYVVRSRGDAWIGFERGMLAVFLAGMPMIYLLRWLAYRPENSPPAGLAIELLGLGIYVTLAVLGINRSPWFLAVGIAAHGIVWDVSHYNSTFMPSWYAIMCLLVDIGLGIYTAARIPGWRRAGATLAAARATPRAAGR